MNIILTHTFLNIFKKDFRKNNFLITYLVKELKKEKILKLEYPFFKVKLNMNSIAIRGIILLNTNNKVIPIYFVLKKDKKYGENLILDKIIKEKINLLMKKFEEDFINGNYININFKNLLCEITSNVVFFVFKKFSNSFFVFYKKFIIL